MRQLCEDFPRIDIRQIDFGRGTPWQYPPPTGIAVSVVGYAVHVIDGAADFFVAIERTECNYGGSRAWFLCPRCGDRRAVLYDGGDETFGCRRCMRLIHTSATECELDRRLRKMKKAATRLAEYNANQKWQRWATFKRIYSQRVKAERDVVLCSIGWVSPG